MEEELSTQQLQEGQPIDTTTIPETLPDQEPDYTSQVKYYPAPNGGNIGVSTVDLSIPENKQAMEDEYREWWEYGRDKALGLFPYVEGEARDEREDLKDKFYNKYYGMPYEEYKEYKAQDFKKNGGLYPGSNNAINNIRDSLQTLSIPGLSYADFTNNLLANVVPGYNELDKRWDEVTELDNPIKQGVRDILAVVLPAYHSGAGIEKGLAKIGINKYPQLTRALARVGLHGTSDGLIAAMSDFTEEPTASTVVAELLPEWFGPKGYVPLPEAWKWKASNSTEMNKLAHFYENFGLAAITSIVGSFIDFKAFKAGGNRTPLDTIIPLDEASKQYKQLELFKLTTGDDLVRYQQIQELLSRKNLLPENEKLLMDELMTIENSKLGSKATDLESKIQRNEIVSRVESDSAARRKLSQQTVDQQLELNLDPDITPGLLDERSGAKSITPPANVARNIIDTTTIKTGNTTGLPAPILTDSMIEKGLGIGTGSRGAIMGVAEETRDIGKFDAIVEGIRYSSEQMNAAAQDIYTSIIEPAATLDDVKALFVENRDVKNFLLGKFKVEVFSEEQARAAAFALRDLTDQFLGADVRRASGRVMDTVGRESANLGEAIQIGGSFINDSRAMDLIIDKMQFLLDEYALNKYVSGWALRNKNWWNEIAPGSLDEVVEELTKDFTDTANSIYTRNAQFIESLKVLKNTKPHFVRALIDAYTMTNGDVVSLNSLNKFAESQISALGILKTPDSNLYRSEMNLFAKSLYSVMMNNMLSGLSAPRAMLGAIHGITTKPITALAGHGLLGAVTGDFQGFKRTLYYYSSIFETNRRALGHAFTIMKKAHKDPDLMIRSYRKDFQIQSDRRWDFMDDMAKAWEKEGNTGKLMQYNMARNMYDFSRNPIMRFGMTGLVFPDAYTASMTGTMLSRTRAYADAIEELGFTDIKALEVAELRHYKQLFDKEGLVNDEVLKNIAGEIQLNLDDGLSNWINRGVNNYPLLKLFAMFPRATSNYIKASASWTPLSAIPNFNRYSKTIYAKTQEEIAQALAEHGINMATEPHAMTLFENLRAEYLGRLVFSTTLVGSLWQYALGGNIRGNGNYRSDIRIKERNQFGYEPKTINIGGNWVSYEGLWGVEQVLSILGDLAYNLNDIDEPLLQNWHSKLAWTLSASFLNESPLQGFEPLISILNGDINGFNRIAANVLRSTIPLSGTAGVLANAISSAQKDIEGDVKSIIMNRLPGLNLLLAERIDFWTGTPVNDIDNPFLRFLNAVSPVKVSGTKEPWRQFLQDIQWNGYHRLNKHSSGAYRYTPEDREIILKYMGEDQLYKEIEKLMEDKKLLQSVEDLRRHRSQNVFRINEHLDLDKDLLPIYRIIDRIVKNSQQKAEFRLEMEKNNGLIDTINSTQRYVDQQMRQGNVQDAGKALQNFKDNTTKQKLLNFGGSR